MIHRKGIDEGTKRSADEEKGRTINRGSHSCFMAHWLQSQGTAVGLDGQVEGSQQCNENKKDKHVGRIPEKCKYKKTGGNEGVDD